MKYRILILGTLLLSILARYSIFTRELIGVHMWRQTLTQWNIRNFYRHSFDILNPRLAALNEDFDNVVLLEFPLMQWVIASIHHIFGGSDSIAITRLSLLGLSVISLIGAYRLIINITDQVEVAAWVCCFLIFSPLFYYYSINPIPDNIALCFTFWFFAFLIKYYKTRKEVFLYSSALMLSLATLVKLPFVIAGAGVFGVFVCLYDEKNWKLSMKLIFVFFVSMIPPFFWYRRSMINWDRQGPMSGVFGEDHSLEYMLELIQYHIFDTFPLRVMGLGLLLLFLIGLYDKLRLRKKWGVISKVFLFSGIACVLYFLYEITIIDKVHDYYLMPFVPYVLVVGTLGVSVLLQHRYGLRLLSALLMISALFTFYTANQNWTQEQSYFPDDFLSNLEELKSVVPDGNDCIFLNDASGTIMSYHMDQLGYMFNNDYLPIHWIHDIIDRGGVRYMYSDSRKVDNSQAFQPYIDSLLLQKGTFKVWKLKLPDSKK